MPTLRSAGSYEPVAPLGQTLVREPAFPQTIGACIYCGCRDEDLSDEHVIPFALGGNWILKKASCRAHRDLTSAIEGAVLHHAWGPARAALGIQTRHKQSRSKGLPVRLERNGRVESISVPIEQHPAALVMLVFAPPGVMPAKPKIAGTPVIRMPGGYRRGKAEDLVSRYGAGGVRVRYPAPTSYARFLAKVAYSFVVACDGLEACRDTPVLAALLGIGPSIFKFVGNDDALGTHTANDVQQVTMASDDRGRLVFIRLLGTLAPEYVVRIDSPGTGYP
jgi:hypothetical protein